MIKKHVSASARRARNIVWNAAGAYDFEPPFLAFYPNGKSDTYFNMVIGLTAKYYDLKRVEDFFASYGNAARAEEFDEFLWLGIENEVYEKEIAERPILSELRRKRAEEFFAVLPTLSRQQMMYSSMPVFTQQEARWATVLGKRLPVLSAREKAIYEALQFSEKMAAAEDVLPEKNSGSASEDCRQDRGFATDRLLQEMGDFLRAYFHYDVTHAPGKAAGPSLAREIADRLLRHESRRRDVLFLRAGTGLGDRDLSVSLDHFGSPQKVQGPDAEDEAYIRACFGASALTESQLLTLEQDLCTGPDAPCRLWVTKADRQLPAGDNMGEAHSLTAVGNGKTEPAEASADARRDAAVRNAFPKSAEELHEKRSAQAARNRNYLSANARLISAQITRLSGQLETLFESWLHFLPERASSGSLLAREAWQMKLLGRPDVFEKSGDQAEKDIALTLLIDASMSRVNMQEAIAAEAFVIAKSLMAAGVPVQVAAFRSLRGYTVIEVLKDFDDRSCDGISAFYSGGWNRDSLAIPAMGSLLRDARDRDGRRHILFALTDGNPNDSTPLAGTGKIRMQEYQGAPAVQLTKEAVASLRKDGIRTGAIFHGATYHLESIHQIYGQDYVRIQKVDQLAEAVTELLLRELRKLDISG